MHGYLISTPSGQKLRYKNLRLYAKMTGKGGAAGGSYFSELGRVLGCHMPNFRSLGKSLHIDNFCKKEGGWGGEGGPYYPFVQKSHKKMSPNQKKNLNRSKKVLSG